MHADTRIPLTALSSHLGLDTLFVGAGFARSVMAERVAIEAGMGIATKTRSTPRVSPQFFKPLE